MRRNERRRVGATFEARFILVSLLFPRYNVRRVAEFDAEGRAFSMASRDAYQPSYLGGSRGAAR